MGGSCLLRFLGTERGQSEGEPERSSPLGGRLDRSLRAVKDYFDLDLAPCCRRTFCCRFRLSARRMLSQSNS